MVGAWWVGGVLYALLLYHYYCCSTTLTRHGGTRYLANERAPTKLSLCSAIERSVERSRPRYVTGDRKTMEIPIPYSNKPLRGRTHVLLCVLMCFCTWWVGGWSVGGVLYALLLWFYWC